MISFCPICFFILFSFVILVSYLSSVTFVEDTLVNLLLISYSHYSHLVSQSHLPPYQRPSLFFFFFNLRYFPGLLKYNGSGEVNLLRYRSVFLFRNHSVRIWCVFSTFPNIIFSHYLSLSFTFHLFTILFLSIAHSVNLIIVPSFPLLFALS